MSAKAIREAFAAKKLQSAIVDVAGVGKVMVRELMVGDLDSVDHDGTPEARAKNIALAIYTEDGAERIFDHESPEDVAIIMGLGNRSVNKIIEALAEKN
ncbi:hypothetical protein H0A71_06090 [Alcaligenaceae bacterium]|nr:hypothetical protein [Alcaligenaceae bacterium]